MRFTKLAILLACCTPFCGPFALAAEREDHKTPVAEDTVSFNRDIRPLLATHCIACHGGVKVAGDVSFVNPNAVLPPDGWIIEPGSPDESVLIERIESDDPDLRMPPPDHGDKLSESDIALLRKWIEQNAPWEQHWAFEKPKRPTVPSNGDEWARGPIDQFVLEGLHERALAPNPEAKPERWLRRVALDLTGLPPTPDQVSAFLQQVEELGDAAYEDAVDGFLQSHAYGERWASVWLDQVRYADSRGLGMDGPRNIWKYRDWVIDAFNKDMPYSEFTIKQMAGDLLPDATISDRVATAVHRLTQSNEEGGTDDEQFRVEAVLDRVNTTWQTWQGVTFGCAQCHSHPYDPFTHEDYYRFSAFFNNTLDCDLNDDWPQVQAPLEDNRIAEATELDAKINEKNRSIWQREYALLEDAEIWNPITELTASTNNDTQVEVEPKSTHAEFHTVDTVSRGTRITLTSEIPDGVEQITAIRFTGMPLNPETALSDSEWGFVLSHVDARWVLPEDKIGDPAAFAELRESEQPENSEQTESEAESENKAVANDTQAIEFARVIIDEPNPYYDPQESLNSKSREGFAAYSRINYPRSAAFILKNPAAVPAGAKLEFRLRHDFFILSAFPIVTRRGHIAVTDDIKMTELLTDASIEADRAELVTLKKQRRDIPSTSVPVMSERDERFRRPSHIFIRGLFLTKGNEVQPGTPGSMYAMPEEHPADRLGLAEWLVSRENPLTARVAVNRVWARLFGVGIVETEEDFGSSGEAPSHPELLDFLALRFQDDYGYRFKPLIREIVLSSVYRQSSAVTREQFEQDASNRFLARGPRHRLPAEVVRDQSLAFAGLLSDKVGGSPVRPPIPDGVWRPFASWDKWETAKSDDPNRYRKSIYTYMKRSIPYPMFASFDAPSREFCSPRRLRSNTPLQALATLNDETFAECARGLSKRMQSASETEDEQLAFGFRLVTCREASDREIAELRELKHSYEEPDSPEAMQAVARVLLNLDEVLTK